MTETKEESMCFKPYEIDLDENNMLRFTEKNKRIINLCISVDSTYRNNINKEYKGSSANLIDTKGDLKKFGDVQDICKAINTENHTRCSGSDLKAMAAYIKKQSTPINNTLKTATKCDGTLVKKIAGALKTGKFNISLASKFCAYYARYKFNNDSFIIYDKVMRSILPYYIKKYLPNQETYVRMKNGRLVNDMVEKGIDYEDYVDIVTQLVQAINKSEKINLTNEEFDRMLWYYYKGDTELINTALGVVIKAKKKYKT